MSTPRIRSLPLIHEGKVYILGGDSTRRSLNYRNNLEQLVFNANDDVTGTRVLKTSPRLPIGGNLIGGVLH